MDPEFSIVRKMAVLCFVCVSEIIPYLQLLLDIHSLNSGSHWSNQFDRE